MTPAQLAALYVSVWNEPDPIRRRGHIEQLWIPAGAHRVRGRQAIGYQEIELRVQQSHAKNVTDAGCLFRQAGEVQALHDTILFHWEMFHPGSPQDAQANGVQFLRLAPDGRIDADYQFILPTRTGMTSGVIAAGKSAS